MQNNLRLPHGRTITGWYLDQMFFGNVMGASVLMVTGLAMVGLSVVPVHITHRLVPLRNIEVEVSWNASISVEASEKPDHVILTLTRDLDDLAHEIQTRTGQLGDLGLTPNGRLALRYVFPSALALELIEKALDMGADFDHDMNGCLTGA